jgi:ABC-type multidrug transport system ATPase subunit
MMATKGHYRPIATIDGDLKHDDEESNPAEMWLKEQYHQRKRVGVDCDRLYVGRGRHLLDDISFTIPPATLTAIMGPSGAGKTMLLDAMMGNTRRSSVRWFVQLTTVSEDEAKRREQALDEVMLGVSGDGDDEDDDERDSDPLTHAYVPQHAELCAFQTVEETLWTAAALKRPTWTAAARKQWVDQLIRLLDLESCRRVRVGRAGWNDGASRFVMCQDGEGAQQHRHARLSGGQRKRLSIGKELVSLPHVLMVDEPTSGLDATCAVDVVRLLHVIAKAGATVIMTLHQPTAHMFTLCQHFILLEQGKLIFAGDQRRLTAVLHQLPHAKQEPHMSTPEFVADLLRCNRGSEIRRQHDLLESGTWYDGKEQRVLVELPLLQDDACGKRTCTLMRRALVGQWRDPAALWVRLVLFSALTITIGLVAHLVEGGPSTQERIAVHFFMATVLNALTIIAMPMLLVDNDLYAQETRNGHYGPLPYTCTNAVVQLPMLALLSVVCTSLQFMLVPDMPWSNWTWSFAIMFVSLYTTESAMAVVCAIWPAVSQALLIGTAMAAFNVLLCGFFFTPTRLPEPLRTMHYADLATYHFRAVVYLDFHHRHDNGDAILSAIGFETVNVSLTLIGMSLVATCCRLLTWAVLTWRQRYRHESKLDRHCVDSCCVDSNWTDDNS